jgi:hypothetical protein
MARLVVVTHEFDRFVVRRKRWLPRASPYLLFDVLREIEKLGHSWRITTGPNPLDGDAALLHVDCTVVDEAYLALGGHYARTFNFGTGDISKRAVSRTLLEKGGDWMGPVIVKANLNAQGWMETRHNERAARVGRPLPHPAAPMTGPYQIVARLADVDQEVWSNPDLVVERFLPEIDEAGGYALRCWIFMGNRERCTRMVAADPIVKAGAVTRFGAVEVPAELRAERERLKFDFGKFDFVIHDGRPILIDANRTPTRAAPLKGLTKAGAPLLAEGLDAMLRGWA